MNKYEYKRVCCRYCDDEIKKLNELGQDGWQLVSIVVNDPYNVNKYLYLMREIC